MKRPLTSLVALIAAILCFSLFSFGIYSCRRSVCCEMRLGDWKQAAPFTGLPRNGATVFVIGSKAFVGTGFNADSKQYLNDFYAYDGLTSSWSVIAPFPGAGRVHAVAFSINGKGYVGTGFSGTSASSALKDFYSYDTSSKAWSKIADFAGDARGQACGFALNNVGYVGTGSANSNGILANTNDFYSYDPTADAWTAISPYPGPKVHAPFSFVINSEAYIGGGDLSGSDADNSFYSYNPSQKTWNKLPKLDSLTPNVKRYSCASFSQNGLGYIVCGAPNQSSTVFEFNPANKYWTQKVDFEGQYRSDCIGFSFGQPPSNQGGYASFIGLGTSTNNSSPLSDVWSFNPLVARILNN